MAALSALQNLLNFLTAKFEDLLVFRLTENATGPFIIVHQVSSRDLYFIPSFHMVITSTQEENIFTVKLLTFHGKLLIEAALDASVEDDEQLLLLRQYASNHAFKLCRGMLYNSDSSFAEDILIERLEEELIVRSLDCQFLVVRDGEHVDEAEHPLCEACQQKFRVFISDEESAQHIQNEVDEETMSEATVVRTVDVDDDEDDEEDSAESPSKIAESIMEKLRPLKVPVTVLVGVSTLTKPAGNGGLIFGPPPKIEPNVCVWCGLEFLTLYLFQEHVKVCSMNPRANMIEVEVSNLTKPRSSKSIYINRTPKKRKKGDPPAEPFKAACRICLQNFSYKSSLNAHMRKHKRKIKVDLSAPIECPKCQEVVRKRMLLNHHYALKHPDPVNNGICCECLKTMPSKKLWAHMYYKNEKRPKRLCPHCGQRMNYAYQLQVHMSTYHRDKITPAEGAPVEEDTDHVCDQCGKVFVHSFLLNNHVRRQHKHANDYPCKYCAKTFNNPWNLREHMGSMHLKLRPFKCRDCDYVTTYRNNVYKHYEKNHAEKASPDVVIVLPDVLEELRKCVDKDADRATSTTIVVTSASDSLV